MIRLAHVSDPHLPIVHRPTALQFASKRAIGWVSWRKRRSLIHRQEVLDALASDLKEQNVDHLAITGDLGNISLPLEFEIAGQWLRSLGSPADVSVVPGNHDAYVGVPWKESLGHWAPFMTGDDEPAMDTSGVIQFPFVRRRSSVAVIGLCTAIPTPPGFASGKLGRRQLTALESILRDLGSEGFYRIILLHHPPVSVGVSPLARLTDSRDFGAIIASVGAELILHGHNHRFQVHPLKAPSGPVPVVGAPSASIKLMPGKYSGGYCVYDIHPTNPNAGLTITLRSFNADRMEFQASDSRVFRGSEVLKTAS